MPGFFANLPVLSAIPNPLNLFNGDNDDSSLDSPSRSSPSTSRQSTMQSLGSSKPAPILEGNGTPQGRKASGASVVIADADLESDSPRSGRSGASSGVTSAVSNTLTTGGRPRGLSVVSGISGGESNGGGRRKKHRVETFVLVKPPPTTAKNPLNLQVQLVINEKRTRPRRPSDAVSRAVQASGDLSSAPSTPQRQSYEQLEDCPDPEKTPTAADAPTAAAAVLAQGTTRMSRSNSVASNRSSSAASAASGVSAASTASGKRIIPLYNLAVHNVVQPTIVTDAGTDSRVAKFSKRQLDIAGVGILEPSEVWLPYVGQPAGSPRPSFDGPRAGRPVSMISNMSSLTPATSRADDGKRSDTRPNKQDTLSSAPEDGAKKFFGKIFRKRGSADPLVERRAAVKSPVPSSKSSNYLNVDSNSLMVPSAPSSPQMPSVHFPNDVVPSLPQIGHPTFGLAPNVLTRRLSETTLDPSGAIVGITSDVLPNPSKDETVSLLRSSRPVGYSWTVRKWAKKSTDGWAAHLVAAAAAGLDLVAGAMPGDGDDDVVFEWVKLRVSPNGAGAEAVLRKHLAAEQIELRRKRGPPNGLSPRPSPAGSRTSLALKGKTKTENNLSIESGAGASAANPRSKIFRRASLSLRRNTNDQIEIVVPATISGKSSKPPSLTTTSGSGSPPLGDDVPSAFEGAPADDDYDSDPEDSETPWQCSVWVKRTGQRQLIATLTPAPHHPKVIGVLRIPAGVRSICLTEIGSETHQMQALPNLGAPSNVTSLNSPGIQTDQNGFPNSLLRTATNAEAAQRVREEIALTEENIKDVVSVTAMWLVAREEFGGLGAKSKSKR